MRGGGYIDALACRYALRRVGAWSSSLRSQRSAAVKVCDQPLTIMASTQLNVHCDNRLARGS